MYKVSFNEPNAASNLSKELYKLIGKDRRFIIPICIGTDRSTGDSLGPIVGSKLHELGHKYVEGTLKEPVHAVNLHEVIKKYNKREHLIIAIDACLGNVTSIGKIEIKDSPLKPGAGVGKELPEVGEISIHGIVNVGGFMEYFVLQNTRLGLVMEMADIIADSVNHAILATYQSRRIYEVI